MLSASIPPWSTSVSAARSTRSLLNGSRAFLVRAMALDKLTPYVKLTLYVYEGGRDEDDRPRAVRYRRSRAPRGAQAGDRRRPSTRPRARLLREPRRVVRRLRA